MRFSPEQVESRREFVRAAVRYSLLAVLAAAATCLGRNRGSSQQRCIRRSFCRECTVFAECELPQALSARQVLHRYKGD